MRKLFIVVFILTHVFSKAQEKAGTGTRAIKDSVVQPVSRWPFLNTHIPPFLGITAGLEGFPMTTYSLGIFHNIFLLNSYGDFSKTGARVGYGLYYKKNMNHLYPWTVEADLGMYGGLTMGVNVNYNRLNNDQKIIGVKPYIGISACHLDFLYGFNFFSNKKDKMDQLDHHCFTLRLTIPVVKLTKKKSVTVYTYKDDDSWDE